MRRRCRGNAASREDGRLAGILGRTLAPLGIPQSFLGTQHLVVRLHEGEVVEVALPLV